MRSITLALLSLFAMLSACSKDDSNDGGSNPITPSIESISGNYKLGSLVEIVGGVRKDVTSSSFTSCELDDVFQLKKDKTYAVVDAGVVCTPPTTDSGTWNLVGTKIYFDGDEYSLDSFDGKKLVYSVMETVGGVVVKVEFTFNKQ